MLKHLYVLSHKLAYDTQVTLFFKEMPINRELGVQHTKRDNGLWCHINRHAMLVRRTYPHVLSPFASKSKQSAEYNNDASHHLQCDKHLMLLI